MTTKSAIENTKPSGKRFKKRKVIRRIVTSSSDEDSAVSKAGKSDGTTGTRVEKVEKSQTTVEKQDDVLNPPIRDDENHESTLEKEDVRNPPIRDDENLGSTLEKEDDLLNPPIRDNEKVELTLEMEDEPHDVPHPSSRDTQNIQETNETGRCMRLRLESIVLHVK
jgi:hypothetical protein